MKNKRNLTIIIGLLVFIMMIGGISYSIFIYNKNVANVTLNMGEISISLANVNNYLSNNSLPSTDVEGITSSEYIDFTVNSTVDAEPILYEIQILPKTGNTLDTSHIKVYLTDQEENKIIGPVYYNNLFDSLANDGKSLYQYLVENTSSNPSINSTHNYRLRLWLDESYSEATSKTFEFNINLYAINVNKSDYAKVIIDIGDGVSLVKYLDNDDDFTTLPTPVRENYTFNGWIVGEETLDTEDKVSKYKTASFTHFGAQKFDGSNYIDTGVKLFSEETWNKNFYLSFEIKENNMADNRETLVGSTNEVGSPYPGLNIRRYNTTSNLQIQANAPGGTNGSKTNIPISTTEKIELLRLNGKIYYNINSSGFVQLGSADYTGFNAPFDWSVTFGAAYKSDGTTPEKFFHGTLSNMIIYFLDNEATTSNYLEHFDNSINVTANWTRNRIKVNFDANGGRVTTRSKTYAINSNYGELPIPTRDGYEFIGWTYKNGFVDNQTKVIAGFQNKDDYWFYGNNYIDTEIPLFNEDNIKRNFYISFDIEENNSTNKWATLVSASEVNGDRGIKLQRNDNNDVYRMKVHLGSGTAYEKNDIDYNTQNVKILRINGIVYYSIDDGSFIETKDFSSFTNYFDSPVLFGANYGSNSVPQQYFTGVLSNMVITFLDSSATTSNYLDHFDNEMDEDITLVAKWTKSKYTYNGDYAFDGTNYIDTGIELFSEDNWSRNAYVEFTIQQNDSTIKQATIFNSKYEQASNYPGFTFRRDESTSTYNISANVNSSSKNSLGSLGSFDTTKKVRFLRIDKVLYYSFNDDSFTKVLDYKDFNLYFNQSATFGAGLTTSGAGQRYFIGVLSNMRVEFISDDATLDDYTNYIRS